MSPYKDPDRQRQWQRDRQRRLNVMTVTNSAGETRTVREWSRLLGIKPITLRARLRAGFSVDEALSTVRAPRAARHTLNGETLTVAGWARRLNWRSDSLRSRLQRMPVEQALVPAPEGPQTVQPRTHDTPALLRFRAHLEHRAQQLGCSLFDAYRHFCEVRHLPLDSFASLLNAQMPDAEVYQEEETTDG
jgi:hypothetical protein